MPDFAAAFEDALAHEDLDKLKTMTEQMPRLRSLILLAQAILGDSGAAAKVADLLGSEDMADHDGVAIRILRPRFRQALTLIESGLAPVDAVAQCEKQLRLAIYDTNEAVSAPDLMAA